MFQGLVELLADHLRDAVAPHGHAEQRVGHLHGAPLVGYHDELGLAAQAVDVGGQTAQVRVVERCFHLVQDIERGAANAVHREQKRKRRERFLAADRSIIFAMRLPSGWAFTSTPEFFRSSGSTSERLALPPGNSVANISWKFLSMAS